MMNFAGMRTARSNTAGFTRTELFVLLGVGTILSGVLGADLNQAKSKLLQQACAANLKQWGMAINLYAQDYNGSYYYLSQASINFDDNASPYAKYLGAGSSNTVVMTMRTMRTCPEVAARLPLSLTSIPAFHNYSMPIPWVFVQGTYTNLDALPGSASNIFPTLRYLNQPSQYLLMIDSGGHTMHCSDLLSGTIGANSTPSGDTVRAIDRHGGSLNCLFGDFHVELVSAQTISNIAAIPCGGATGNPWFRMN